LKGKKKEKKKTLSKTFLHIIKKKSPLGKGGKVEVSIPSLRTKKKEGAKKKKKILKGGGGGKRGFDLPGENRTPSFLNKQKKKKTQGASFTGPLFIAPCLDHCLFREQKESTREEKEREVRAQILYRCKTGTGKEGGMGIARECWVGEERKGKGRYGKRPLPEHDRVPKKGETVGEKLT